MGTRVIASSKAKATPAPSAHPSCWKMGVGTRLRLTNPTKVVMEVSRQALPTSWALDWTASSRSSPSSRFLR